MRIKYIQFLQEKSVQECTFIGQGDNLFFGCTTNSVHKSEIIFNLPRYVWKENCRLKGKNWEERREPGNYKSVSRLVISWNTQWTFLARKASLINSLKYNFSWNQFHENFVNFMKLIFTKKNNYDVKNAHSGIKKDQRV